MPPLQFVTIFLLEDVTLLFYTLLVLKSSQFFKNKKCDQVQKLVRPCGPVPPGLEQVSEQTDTRCSQAIERLKPITES